MKTTRAYHRRTPVTRICENWACGKAYVVPLPNRYAGQRPQRHCSTKCARMTKRRDYLYRPIAFCLNPACGKAFAIKPYTAGKYCSMLCANKSTNAKRRAPSMICQNPACARQFVIPKTHNKQNGPRQFCSKACHFEAAKTIGRWSGPRKRKPCARLEACVACGAALPKWRLKYCSDACAAPPAKYCRDCGVAVQRWARRCWQCRELHEMRQYLFRREREREQKRIARKEARNIGHELIQMFPELRAVMRDELNGYSGNDRRDRRREILRRIGAEGKTMFNLKRIVP